MVLISGYTLPVPISRIEGQSTAMVKGWTRGRWTDQITFLDYSIFFAYYVNVESPTSD